MARLAFDLSVLRVLLVEDDTFARELATTALRQIGIKRIVIASDGAEARDALERGAAFDLVMSDWNMPHFDGIDLVKAVRGRWPDLPFLMVTNNEALDQVSTAIDAGVDGGLVKPYSLDKLREVMQMSLVTRLTASGVISPAGRGGSPANPELKDIAATIRDAIAPPAGVAAAPSASGNGASPEAVQDANRFAERLSDQLTGFVDTLDAVDGNQLDVIRLHVDCVRAVLSGRQDLLTHETRNLIVDGLGFAIDLVSEKAGGRQT